MIYPTGKNLQILTELALRQRVAQIVPGFDAKDAWGSTVDGVRIEVKPPREYMGRFDAGKFNWTIDLKEISTYSRKRQVRVRVDPDGTAHFDEKKLLRVIAELKSVIATVELARKNAAAALKKVPYMDADILRPEGDKYRVRIERVCSLEKLHRLAKFLKTL